MGFEQCLLRVVLANELEHPLARFGFHSEGPLDDLAGADVDPRLIATDRKSRCWSDHRPRLRAWSSKLVK